MTLKIQTNTLTNGQILYLPKPIDMSRKEPSEKPSDQPHSFMPKNKPTDQPSDQPTSTSTICNTNINFNIYDLRDEEPDSITSMGKIYLYGSVNESNTMELNTTINIYFEVDLIT